MNFLVKYISIVFLLIIGISNISAAKNVDILLSTDNLKTLYGKKISDLKAKNKDTLFIKKGNYGELVFGNNDISLDKGVYEVSYRLKTDDISGKKELGTLLIDGISNNQQGFYKEILGKYFKESYKYRTLKFQFRIDKDNTIVHPWVFSSGESSLWIDYIEIKKSKKRIEYKVNDKKKIVYEENNLYSTIGNINNSDDNSNGKSILSNNKYGFLTWGPYSTNEKKGSHRSVFRLKTDNNSNTNELGRIEVFNSKGSAINKNLIIRGTDFKENNKYQDFSIDYYRTSDGTIEFKTLFYNAGSTLELDNITSYGTLVNNNDIILNNVNTTNELIITFEESISENRKIYTFSNDTGKIKDILDTKKNFSTKNMNGYTVTSINNDDSFELKIDSVSNKFDDIYVYIIDGKSKSLYKIDSNKKTGIINEKAGNISFKKTK